jgi:hypothetical protein
VLFYSTFFWKCQGRTSESDFRQDVGSSNVQRRLGEQRMPDAQQGIQEKIHRHNTTRDQAAIENVTLEQSFNNSIPVITEILYLESLC